MNTVELFSIIASVVSTTLACVAIILAIVFYRMSSRLAESIRQSDHNVSSGIARLEKLFDTLYRDAQGMVRQTVEDLRGNNHRPGDGQVRPGPVTDPQLDRIKREIIDGIRAAANSTRHASGDELRSAEEIAELIDRAIAQSRP